MVQNDVITIQKLMDLLTFNARKRFNITSDVGFSVWDLDAEYEIDAKEFLSKGKDKFDEFIVCFNSSFSCSWLFIS